MKKAKWIVVGLAVVMLTAGCGAGSRGRRGGSASQVAEGDLMRVEEAANRAEAAANRAEAAADRASMAAEKGEVLFHRGLRK
jgi:hypothetical protein